MIILKKLAAPNEKMKEVIDENPYFKSRSKRRRRWTMECINPRPCRLFQLGLYKRGALDNIKDAAEIYIEDMIESGEDIPAPSDKIEVLDEPAVAISL